MGTQEVPAQTFLVQEIRAARVAAGLNQEDLGKAINYSSSMVSAVENGQRPLTREYVVAVDRALNRGGLLEGLLVGLDQTPVWLRDWVVFLREATLVRWFELSVMPGHLQTEAYARAIMEANSLFSAAQIERSIASRLERQSALTRPDPPTFVAIIDENVLHRPVGSAEVMAAQCEHLLACAAKPHIYLHVVPATTGAYMGLVGPLIIATAQDFQIAHLDTAFQSQLVDTPETVNTLIRRWEAIRSEALPQSQTVKLIKEMVMKWKD